MKIETVKLQDSGFLVNGNMHVPEAEGNRHYKMVQEWIAEGNLPEAQYTEAELLAKQESEAYQAKIQSVNDITIEYLGKTFSGNPTAQNNIVTAIAKLEGKGDTKTQNWFTVDKELVKLTRDDFDNILDIIEPLQEALLDD